MPKRESPSPLPGPDAKRRKGPEALDQTVADRLTAIEDEIDALEVKTRIEHLKVSFEHEPAKQVLYKERGELVSGNLKDFIPLRLENLCSGAFTTAEAKFFGKYAEGFHVNQHLDVKGSYELTITLKSDAKEICSPLKLYKKVEVDAKGNPVKVETTKLDFANATDDVYVQNAAGIDAMREELTKSGFEIDPSTLEVVSLLDWFADPKSGGLDDPCTDAIMGLWMNLLREQDDGSEYDSEDEEEGSAEASNE